MDDQRQRHTDFRFADRACHAASPTPRTESRAANDADANADAILLIRSRSSKVYETLEVCALDWKFFLMQYHLLTLGCAKNVADSDGIGAMLAQAGMNNAERADDADVLIVNTCGFLQASRQESLAALRDLARPKAR